VRERNEETAKAREAQSTARRNPLASPSVPPGRSSRLRDFFARPVVTAGSQGYYRARPAYADLLREAGLPDGVSVFEHPGITPWRQLDGRENCTLDFDRADGTRVRLHVKRYDARGAAAVEAEAEGIRLLEAAGIATTPLVATGVVQGRGAFLITEDLHGFTPCDKLLDTGTAFEALLAPTAATAAALHRAPLHHRDLYLCHFLARPAAPADVRLIDAARVRKLPRLFRRRWVVKDLAQFWYSTTKHRQITDKQRDAWLAAYAQPAGERDVQALKRRVLGKVAWIARHDRKLSAAQPTRNVSIPE